MDLSNMNNFDPTVVASEDEMILAQGGAGGIGALTGTRTTNSAARHRLPLLLNMLKFSDVMALLVASFGGFFLRFGFAAKLSQTDHLFIYLSTLVTIVSLHLAQAYRTRSLTSLYSLLSTLLVGAMGALSLILVCCYLSGTLSAYSRVWFVSSALTSFALLLANRVAISQIVYRARQADMLTESIVVVGANERAELIIDSIRGTAHSNIKILGVFDDRVERDLPATLRPQMLGSTNTLINYIRINHVDRVVVALPWVATDRIEALLKKLRTVPVRIDLVPNNVVWQFPSISMERLANVPVLTVANSRVDEQMGLIKRIEDLVISSILLALISPLLLLIAMVIKLDSPGPVIFKQRRHGFNNQVFEVYKFRSMTVADSSSTEVVQATKNDRRVTRVGKFLRRSSLDELPQLFNVLFGDMSIVGPRPHAVQHNLEFGAIISEYYARHNVKPGITGWAQVNGLRGETDTVDKMHRRVEFDLHYIEHWSLMLDLKILVMTGFSVWFQANAY
jgi:Undecaprenyl-phosphate glucose phosphotransferase